MKPVKSCNRQGMGSFQNILVLDSAMNGCGVCVRTGGQNFARVVHMSGGQSEHLMPMIDAAVKEAGIAYADLGAIVVTPGPGAFTGLRIGLSTARALSLSLDIPVYGITTLQALALKYASEKKGAAFAVLVETKRTDFYVQRFDADGKAVSEIEALEYTEAFGRLKDEVLIGDALGRWAAVGDFEAARLQAGYDLPDPAFIAQYFEQNFDKNDIFTQNPEPVYLREADVSQSKTVQRKIS
jgi:tRNA threonylcarbamoyladenosine biosynthesis protein TsaB